jgi:preprotein translocase subunit SecY
VAVRLEGIASWFFILTGVVTLTGGTMLLMWMGEQITARGIGNGISLIIFAGIIAEMPRAIFNLVAQARTTSVDIGFILAIVVMVIALVVFIVFIERSQRRLIIHYPKRQQAQGFAQGQKSFLPLKINTSGVIPAIFATALLMLPLTAVGFLGGNPADTESTGMTGVMGWLETNFAPGSWTYIIS